MLFMPNELIIAHENAAIYCRWTTHSVIKIAVPATALITNKITNLNDDDYYKNSTKNATTLTGKSSTTFLGQVM